MDGKMDVKGTRINKVENIKKKIRIFILMEWKMIKTYKNIIKNTLKIIK